MSASAIVVGAGIFGVSVADRLAGAGWQVELVEQYQPGHVRQSSGGESRLIRYSHGTDAWHSALAWQALGMWREIEEDTGADLLSPSGLVWFAREEGGWEADSAATLTRLGIPCERLTPDRVGELYPSVRTDDLAFGLYEPDAGVLRAAAAVRTLADRARRRGATLTAARAEPAGKAVRIGDEVRHADVVVWACGPWLPGVLPGLAEVTVTQQDVVFFGAGPEWSSPAVPAWIDFGVAMYGAPDIDGKGFKAAPDADGPPIDPDNDERVALARNLQRARRYMADRFPALADAPVVLTRTCQYTSTPDARWIVAPRPGVPGHWILGAGSGHGFKHGPALAAYVEDLIEGRQAPDPRFGLGHRRAGVHLRTKGT